MKYKKIAVNLIFVTCCAVAVFAVAYYSMGDSAKQSEPYSSTFYSMSTMVQQSLYSNNAQEAALLLQTELVEFEQLTSLYVASSDIAMINEQAGISAVKVDAITASLLAQAKGLTLSSEGAFAITIAPLTLEWGITTQSPSVPSNEKIEQLLLLVDDSAVIIDEENSTVMLKQEGQALDLGGIAKGYACNIARDIYEQYGVESAWLSIGGNIYVKGTKPNGEHYKIGFRDPSSTEVASVASVEIKDAVFSVSGGYERYFEEDGVQYHHIIDPKTGRPSNSDVLTVGIIHEDGVKADYYSTALFVKGMQEVIAYFEQGGTGMAIDIDNNFYVSADLEQSFELTDGEYTPIFIKAK